MAAAVQKLVWNVVELVGVPPLSGAAIGNVSVVPVLTLPYVCPFAR